MAGSEAAGKSPLEKPLAELTEEDIAQVTREDCRRFLKEKGMRRPSWNKSQAVQQVISLKALLEVRNDAEDEPPLAGTVASISPLFSKPPSDALSPAFPFATARPSTAAMLPREVATTTAVEGQLTIFYDGKIKVYDRVTPEKAQVILQVAGSRSFYDLPPSTSLSPSPSFYPNRSPNGNLLSFNSPPTQTVGYLHVPQSSERLLHQFRDGVEEWRSHREVETDGPTSRAASVQRYLEKRKDRFKCKKPSDAGSSHMELLLGQRMSEIYASAAPPRSSLRISIDLNDGS